MRVISQNPIRLTLVAVVCTLSLVSTRAFSSPKASDKDKIEKPTIVLKASPTMGFAPMRVLLTADLIGGPDDYEQFYCPTIEWDMGDGNRSQQQADCEPYEPGKSQIKRRYMKDQTFNIPGDFRVQFAVKQKNKIVGVGRTSIKIRPGLRDIGQ